MFVFITTKSDTAIHVPETKLCPEKHRVIVEKIIPPDFGDFSGFATNRVRVRTSLENAKPKACPIRVDSFTSHFPHIALMPCKKNLNFKPGLPEKSA